jgi:hypothetical protein
MPILRRARRDYIDPDLPDGLFVLINPPDLANEDVDPGLDNMDGPLDPAATVDEPDGTKVFLTEGLPYVLKAVRQEGTTLWTDVGAEEPVPYRVEPFPMEMPPRP